MAIRTSGGSNGSAATRKRSVSLGKWLNFAGSAPLTIVGDQVTAEQFSRLQLALDDLLLPYTIDLSLLRQIDNPDLLAHIDRVGVVFYEREQQTESL
jgi:hypothetical protein